MAIYEAYLSPFTNEQGFLAQFESHQSFKLVEDKKYILALIFPIIWLAWNRLWFWLAVYILAATFFALLANLQVSFIISFLTIIPGLFLYLEGRSLIVAKLEGQGWQLAGVVDAPDVQIAEHKFLASYTEDSQQENRNLPIDSSAEPIISLSAKSIHTNQLPKPQKEDRPMIGIFSES